MTKIYYDTDYLEIYGKLTPDEKFRTRQGTISDVVYSIEASAQGTKQQLLLHISPSPEHAFSPTSSFHGPHTFSYRDEQDISDLLNGFGVTKPEALYAKPVTVHLRQTFWRAGISVSKKPVEEKKIKPLPMIR